LLTVATVALLMYAMILDTACYTQAITLDTTGASTTDLVFRPPPGLQPWSGLKLL